MPDDLSLPGDFEFHHLGYATRSIASEKTFFTGLGYREEGSSFTDHTQGVSGCFMVGPGPRIELLENSEGSDTLTPWINNGTKIYHMAYLVNVIEDAVDWARERRAKIVVAPVPAVAFAGRRISFAMFRNQFLLEFVESVEFRHR